MSSTNLLILLRMRKNCHSSGRKLFLYLFIKKGDKTDCTNYRGISLLQTINRIFCHIVLSSLTPYVEEIILDHQCGFRSNRSPTNHIFCILHILKKVVVVCQLFVDFEKAYYSVRI
jgi:sorting nexin-29